MSAKQATPEQLATLTVPATLPGVVRRGTPVWAWDEDTPWAVLAVDNGEAVCAPCAGLGIPSLIDIGNLQVDLTDATGRAHVAWAVGKVGDSFDVTRDRRQGGLVKVWVGGVVAFVSCWTKLHPKATVVQNLRPLSHEASLWSPAELPDGTPWFKAEALRLVALHALGGGE
jgi:hypothetical protein